MALEDLLGGLYQFNMGLPLQYFNPYAQFQGGQSQNLASLGNAYQGNIGGIGQAGIGGAASLGNSAMGLYGNLANTQASMYQSELPMQMEMQKYNSLAPALSGLLNQFGGGMGGGGMNIAPISMTFKRPDVMAGYQGAVDNSFGQLGKFTDQAYGQAKGAFGDAQAPVQQAGKDFNKQWGDMQNKVFNPPKPAQPPQNPNFTPVPFTPAATPQPYMPFQPMANGRQPRGAAPSAPTAGFGAGGSWYS